MDAMCNDDLLCRFTNCLNGFTAFALTKLDILDQLDEVKICVNYVKNGQPMEHYPSSEQDFEGVSVEYLTLPGWKSDISHCRSFDELPQNAKSYVRKIEEVLGVPIWWVGVGQSRDAMVKNFPSNIKLF